MSNRIPACCRVSSAEEDEFFKMARPGDTGNAVVVRELEVELALQVLKRGMAVVGMFPRLTDASMQWACSVVSNAV